jgi:TolB-like protein/Tfp pilus assembly protein PilF
LDTPSAFQVTAIKVESCRDERFVKARRVNAKNFFAELKRRNVYKVAIAYGVVAWLLLQAASILFPTFEAPPWTMKVFVAVVTLGFPIALIIAWAFELTPEGIKRTDEIEPGRRSRNRAWIYVVVIAGAISAGLFFLGRYTAPTKLSGSANAAAKSIAVLPFENLSEDKANAYFAEGIQDEILTRLSKIADLKVISRTSTQHYRSAPENLREIAKQLGVAHILEGRVQKSGESVRVNVQLIQAASDSHLWADTYDRKLTDIFGVESEIAKTIADQLQAKITGIEKQELAANPTNNPDAYDAYLRGLALYLRGFRAIDFINSTKSLEEAVRLDPRFAQAWALLARGHGNLYFFGFDATAARREAAHEALVTAEKLQPDLAETQLAKGWYLFRVERDFDGAKRVGETLRSKWPNNAEVLTLLSYILARQDHFSESKARVQEALALDPRNVPLLKTVGVCARMERRFTDALKQWDRILDIVPGDPGAILDKVTIYQALGELDKAQALLTTFHPAADDDYMARVLAYQKLLQRRYPDGVALLKSYLASPTPLLRIRLSQIRITLGDFQRLSGDASAANASYARARDELDAQLKQQPDNSEIISALAQAYAGLGDKKVALQYAEQALALRPESQDVVLARLYEEDLARIEARFGEADRAIKVLQHLLTVPYGNPPITPALLRLDPTFDPLRNDPRFQKLCEEKQP